MKKRRNMTKKEKALHDAVIQHEAETLSKLLWKKAGHDFVGEAEFAGVIRVHIKFIYDGSGNGSGRWSETSDFHIQSVTPTPKNKPIVALLEAPKIN